MTEGQLLAKQESDALRARLHDLLSTQVARQQRYDAALRAGLIPRGGFGERLVGNLIQAMATSPTGAYRVGSAVGLDEAHNLKNAIGNMIHFRTRPVQWGHLPEYFDMPRTRKVIQGAASSIGRDLRHR